MAGINYAEQYARALAQSYPYVLNFGALYATENNGRYRMGEDGKTIYIPNISTTGRVAADRDTIATATRNYDNAWEPKTLSNQRKWSTLVHPKDIDQTNEVASIQNITRVFNEEQKFPEMDAYCVSTLYKLWSSTDPKDSSKKAMTANATALTKENVLAVFDKLMLNMDNARVMEGIPSAAGTLDSRLAVYRAFVREMVTKGGLDISPLEETIRGIQDEEKLRKSGITTPRQYQSNGAFARWYDVNAYRVLVTVEEFAENEITAVDVAIAEKTGELMAKMHCISEKNDFHVSNAVMFDPFAANDLFDIDLFLSLAPAFSGGSRELFDRIVRKYGAYMEVLSPLKRQPRYAVQGDISCCNLYQTRSGEVGVFDFNRCGDNNLFCDAVMQAIYEARLMDYQDDAGDEIRPDILASFLKGYRSIRDFSEEQQNYYLYLYTVINAFWRSDIRWRKDSLNNAVKSGNTQRAQAWLETIWQRLTI